jgi:bacterioferritin
MTRYERADREDRTMGTRGREIVGMDVNELLGLLNRAFADEWLAYYQYWLGAKVVKGPMKDAVIAELLQHAADELRHAEMLSLRIIQLGGVPIAEPKEWYQHTHCGYDAPTDPYVMAILGQNVKGEQCAIGVYKKLLETTATKDPVTYNILVQILQDEVGHEEDLQSLVEDIEAMMQAQGR